MLRRGAVSASRRILKAPPVPSISPKQIDPPDFSVAVKSRAKPPKQWKWEIYRSGRTSPIQQSEVCFETMSEATRAGKTALKLLLSEYQH
jgi:hypothetical protein